MTLRHTIASSLAVVGACLSPAGAQSLYSNAAPDRPLSVEDAAALPRFALEAYLGSARLQRAAGLSTWGAEPGVAYGIAPRSEVSIGVPLLVARDADPELVVGGVKASILYAFNVETRRLPAFALRASVLAPTGGLGPERAHESVRGVASRSFSWGSLHFNHEYTFGDEPATSTSIVDLSRRKTGLGYRRAFATRGIMVGVDGIARQPLRAGSESVWDLATGLRAQVFERTTLDAAIHHTFGDVDVWTISVGAGIAGTVPNLIPGLGRWGR